MFRMSQGRFPINLSLIGAFFLNLTFDPLNDLYLWPMTSIVFLICLEYHKDHSMPIWAQSKHFENLTFDPLNDLYHLTYDLHCIFNMFRMSQGSFRVNLSSIGAFLEKLTFDLTFVTPHDLPLGSRLCHMIRLVITYNFCADITHIPNTVLEL